MSQYVICGGDVEEHVGNGPALQELETFELSVRSPAGTLMSAPRALERAPGIALQISMVLAIRARSSSIVFSLSSKRGRLDPGKREAEFFARSPRYLNLPRQGQHSAQAARRPVHWNSNFLAVACANPFSRRRTGFQRMREYVYRQGCIEIFIGRVPRGVFCSGRAFYISTAWRDAAW